MGKQKLDEEQKTQERIKKRQKKLEKHLVICPHCGAKVLDHMTKCHVCGGVLVPRGYQPVDPKKMKLFKGIGWAIGIAAVIVFIVLVILYS